MCESEGRIKLLEAQQDLHFLLRPDTIELCGILQLSDAAKIFVELILDYVIDNHLINRDPTMLQAFQISLCWTAASLLKQKVNHKKSVADAKKQLNFNCKKVEVDYVYAMLQCLKRRLLNHLPRSKTVQSPKGTESSCKYPWKDHSNAKDSLSSQKVASDTGGLSLDQEFTAQKDVSKSIKEIRKKFQKKMKKFHDKQLEERKEILRSYEEEKENLEFMHKTESIVIKTCSWRCVSLTSRRKMWEIEQEKEVEDHKHQMEMRLEHLDKLQLETESKFKEKENKWVEELERWARDELSYRPSLDAPESADRVMVLSETAEHVTDIGEACSGHYTATIAACPIRANSTFDTMTSDAGLFTDVMRKKNSGKSCHDQDNFVSVNSGAKDLINFRGTSDNVEVLPDVTENLCPTAALTKAMTPSLPSFGKCLDNTDLLPITDREVSLEATETVNLVYGPQGPLLLNLTSLEQNPNGTVISGPDREAPEGLHDIVSTSHDLCNVVSEIPTTCEEHVPVISLETMQDKEAEMGLHVVLDDDLGNLVAMDLPQIFIGAREKENGEVHETISTNNDLQNAVSVIRPSYAEQNPVRTLETMLDKVAETEVLDKECNDYATLGKDQGNLESMHSSSFEDRIPVSSSGQQNCEAGVWDSATQVNQQNLVDYEVNENSYQELALESSPLAEQGQGIDMLATSGAAQGGDAQACFNQNTCHPMEDSEFNQVAQAAMQYIASLPALSEQTASQPVTSFSLNQPVYAATNGFDLPFSHTRPTFAASHMPTFPCNCEALQNELERLEREKEESRKSHEDKKLQLKFDMEKGIEELKAQLCQEFEAERQQIEAEFILKKEELLAIHRKVLLHMMLTYAWNQVLNSNVMDESGSSSSGVHHDGNFTVDQQLIRSCMQQNAEMPSLVSNLSSANPSAACRQTTPLAPVTSPQSAAPLIQSVDLLPTPVLSSTNPASHPHISSFSCSTGRPQGTVGIRAPFQHRPCRPSQPFTGGTNALSHEEGSSSHQSQRNSLSSSLREIFLTQTPIPTQISAPCSMQLDHEIAGEPSLTVTGTSPVYQQCGVISNQQPHRNSPPSLPHTPQPLVPMQQFTPNNTVHHLESAVGLPSLRTASALELLMDTSNLSSRRRRSAQNGSRLEPSGESTDLVCLSDDD